MSQIYIDAATSLGLPLNITNPGEIVGATPNALVVGAATGALTSLAVATDGQIPIGSTGAAPVLSTITAGANINVVNGAGTITISATAGNEFADNVFRVYDDGDNTAKLAFECDQITTGTVREITMCDQDLSLIDPDFPGTVTAGTALIVTSGNAAIQAGNLTLPTTNAALTQGAIEINSVPFLHALGTDNVFLGGDSGENVTTAVSSVGIGNSSLENLTTGDDTTAIGFNSLSNLTTGFNNTAIGSSTLENITTGDSNIAVGHNAGSAITTTDSDNILIGNIGVAGDDNVIRIGKQGTGIGEQNNTFIAGIHGVTPTGAYQTVIIDANGELGSTASAVVSEFADSVFTIYDDADNTKELVFQCDQISNGVTRTITMDDRDIDMDEVATSYATDGTTATPAGGIINIVGSGSLSTDGAGNTVTISGGGITWSEVTGTTQAAAVDTGYITNNAAQVDVTLPDTAALGSVVRICGKGAGGVKVSQNAGEQIIWDEVSATTVGVGGYIESTDDYDAVELLCTVANTTWTVLSSKGNWTIV